MKIGDKVRILKPSEWPNALWTTEMLDFVGATGTVVNMTIENSSKRDMVEVEVDDDEEAYWSLYWFYLEDLKIICEPSEEKETETETESETESELEQKLVYTPSSVKFPYTSPSVKSSLAKKLYYDSSALMAFEDEKAAREYYFAKVEKQFNYWFKNLSIIEVYFKED